MNNITYEDLIKQVSSYDIKGVGLIKKAYEKAEELHQNQFRQSGEPYIIHPLNVAYILATMYADRDTICAGLLHDTLEDTTITKEEIALEFNQTIANLVDGVTKISNLGYSKQEQNYANTRKIITGITEDVRIVIIKLADRLHNMRTLSFKSVEKQKENATETLELFVPLAYYIGAYKIKCELEDLSLFYLNPKSYHTILEKKNKIELENKDCLEEMLYKIQTILNSKSIPNEVKIRTKNLYGIYKKINNGMKWSEIHDLLAIKILVSLVDDCYRSLGVVHGEYRTINEDFKDYICNPKTNLYQSLHTTVFGPNNQIVQTRIRTFEMEEVAEYGLTAHWEHNSDDARIIMQERLRDKFQFYKSLTEIDSMYQSNERFVRHVRSELFSDVIHVFTSKGAILELPKDATLVDFAYQIHTNIGNTIDGAYVNGELVDYNYKIKNGDIITIITGSGELLKKDNWEEIVKTSRARRKLRELKKNHN